MFRWIILLPLFLLAGCASQQKAGFLGGGRSADTPVLVAMNDSRPQPSPALTADCSCEQSIADANFGFVHTLASGTKLFVCGNKAAEGGFYGHLYVQAQGEASAEESRIYLGGVSESWEPFATELVQVERRSDGLDLTDLLPWTEKDRLPAFRRHVSCDSRGCAEKFPVCAFRKPRGKVNQKAYEALKRDWNSDVSPAAVEGVKELVQRNGAVSRFGKSREQSDVYMEVYRNALLGHRPSIALLLDEKLNDRLNERYKDEVGELGGFPHNVIHNAITKLHRFHCL